MLSASACMHAASFFLQLSGTKCKFDQHRPIDELKSTKCERNNATLRKLKSRVGEHSEALLQNALTDAKLGRMSPPMVVSDEMRAEFLLAPRHDVVIIRQHSWHVDMSFFIHRFGVAQGAKIRPVDDLTASGVNACAQVQFPPLDAICLCYVSCCTGD